MLITYLAFSFNIFLQSTAVINEVPLYVAFLYHK